jgi:hypothetical protein
MNMCFTCEEYCYKADYCPRCKTIRCNNCGIEYRNKIYCEYHAPKDWQQVIITKKVISSIDSLNEVITMCKVLNWEHEKLTKAFNLILEYQNKLSSK